MKISTEINSAACKIGEERAVEYIAKAGFHAWDFSLTPMCPYNWSTQSVRETSHPLAGKNYVAFARRLKQIGLDNGIVCNQSHAPFPVSCKDIRSHLKRSIECTAEAGGEICIIHPDNNKNADENAELYHELLPFAIEHNVKIATENMWNWDHTNDMATFAACATPESFCKHIDVVNSDYLVACVDIGHAEMKGLNTTASEMIYTLGSKVQALHIHDNDKWHDSHQIPFSMDIDFVPIVKALRDIDYKGYFTLEACSYLNKYSEEDIFTGIKHLADSANKFAKMFEEC